MSFNVIQTFYVDPSAVNQSSKVYLTDVTLYFKSKPSPTNNKSGIRNPGISLFVCEMKNNQPDPENVYPKSLSRMDYNDITSSPDARSATVFKFQGPTLVTTGKYYGIVVKFEDPDFVLWASKQGEHLVGTNTISPGPSGKNDGDYYSPTNSTLSTKDASKDLKFQVGVAKFQATDTVVKIVPYDYEFLDYTNLSGRFTGGEIVYQKMGNTAANCTAYNPGTLIINSSSPTVVGVGTTFDVTVTKGRSIVITDGTPGNTTVHKVQYVTNSTSITLENAPTFSNNSGRYFIAPFGEIYYHRPNNNTMVLINSSANSSVRFVNNAVQYIAFGPGGEGYTNSDYVRVSGGGSTVNAMANVTTDANGTIRSLNFTNNGIGFTTSPTVTIISANGSITNAATMVCNTSMYGGLIVGQTSGAQANVSNVTIYNVDQFRPQIYVNVPTDTFVDMTHVFAYENSGYYVNTALAETTDLSKVNEITKYEGILMSRSLEVVNPSNLYNNDKSAVFFATLRTNRSNTDLYMAPAFSSSKLDIFTFWNNINNDASNEHTASGNAVVKHISTKINFANNRFAEDIRVYLTAYKPAGTDIKVYARIHNSADNESFDDKNWSPLELKEGQGLISSKSDSYIELGYGFPQYANGTLLVGSISTSLSNSTILASESDFTTDLVANDMVKIFSPIFPKNYMIGVVDSVTNSSQIVLKSPVANNDLVGSGFRMERITLKNVAFNNIQNDNVVRYYNSAMVEYDAYDTFQIKIVLLSNSRSVVPRVDDIRSIGVSA